MPCLSNASDVALATAVLASWVAVPWSMGNLFAVPNLIPPAASDAACRAAPPKPYAAAATCRGGAVADSDPNRSGRRAYRRMAPAPAR